MKRSIALLSLLGPALLALLMLAPIDTGQQEKYPLAVSVSFQGGIMPEMESKLINAISRLGYIVRSDAFILMDGMISVSGERKVGGISPKTMLNINLDIQMRDSEQGDILNSFSATGSGLGETWEEAVQKGIERIEIDSTDLSEALADCRDDYFRIKERRYRLSKMRFEDGQRLFEQKRYREAIAALKGVYPETEFFPRAQRLIQDIRMIMPKPVIAVLKFKTNSSDAADNFRDILTTTLVQAEEDITVLEREQISEILGEQELELDGLVDPATASEFGRLIGAGFMLLGRFTVSGSEIEVNARLVRVKTGEIVIGFHRKDFMDRLDMVAREIVDEIHQAMEAGKLDEVIRDDGMVLDMKTPRVMIMIPEVHIHRAILDPAGETEMIRKFVKSGFRVVDQAQVSKIRETREGKAAAKGDAQAAAAIARQHGAEVIIVGEAFSENIPRPGQQLQTCSARVEVRAIDSDTAMILGANGKEAHATDATEGVAAKRALRTAGGLLADDMIKQIVESWERRGGSHEIELLVRKIEYSQLVLLEGFLKDQEGVSGVQRRSFDDGVAVIEIESASNAQSLADALALARLEGFAVKVETVSVNTIETLVEGK